MCHRHQIMLHYYYIVQSVEDYPLDILSISTTTKSITDLKKPPMRNNRDTMGRMTFFCNRMQIRPVLVLYIQIVDSQYRTNPT